MTLSDLKTPIIFAHRGASAYAPENTLSAFHLALAQEAPAIEFDVKLSRDGEVIVLHDQTVDRTTNGSGDVRNLSLAELKKLDASGKFSPVFSDVQIPTLAEVFDELGGKLFMNIELTNYKTPQDTTVDRVVELIREYEVQSSVMFSSFHPVTILKARRLLPEVPAAILALPGRAGKLARGWLGRRVSPLIVHPFTTDVTPAYARQELARPRRIHTWTVNDPADMLRLAKLGVQGIFTDDPILARSTLESA